MNGHAMSRREFIRLSAISLAAGAVAAACGGAPTPTPAKPPAAQPTATKVAAPTATVAAAPQPAAGRVKVTFMVPGSQQEDADFAPVFEEFNKRYSDIEGVYTPAGTGYTDQYNDKVMTMVAGGIAPDVFKTLFPNFGTWADMGIYLPLDDLVQANPDITQFDDFFPNHIEGCKIKGKLMALPNDGAPNGMWYNVDMFEQANVKLPDLEWTWDTLTEAAKAMTKKEGNVITQYGTGRPNWLISVWSNGGDLLDVDFKKCLMAAPEAIEALAWMQNLVVNLKVSPGPQALSEQNESDRFTTGRLGTTFGVRGSLGTFRSIDKFRFDAAPMIMSNKKKRVTQLAIGWTSIWKQSKNPQQAYKLLAWVCSPEGQRLRISRGFAHPSRKSLISQDWFANYTCPKCNSKNVNMVFPEMLMRGEARVPPPHPKLAQINQVVTTELDSLWDGSKTPEQVGAAIVAKVTPLL